MRNTLKTEYDNRIQSYTNWLVYANMWLKKSKFYSKLGLPELAEAAKNTSRRNRAYAAEAYNSALRLRK